MINIEKIANLPPFTEFKKQYNLAFKYDQKNIEAMAISSFSKELNDSRGKNGFFSVKDMIANCAGLLIAAAIINS